MEKITIITPTYNRANLLKILYNSLLKQTVKDFKWLIIDDGSIDETKKVVDKIIDEKKLEIEYVFKENGGKHTALNVAFSNLKTELAVIVDSDDMLTDNAIETIIFYHNKYKKHKKNLWGYVFLRGHDLNTPFVKFPEEETIANYNDYIINAGINGDKCEVFYSNILKKYQFDVYKNEKFIGEGYLWSKISNNYDMVFINKVIYLCEYLEDGLTKSGRTLRLKNPLGGRRHAEEYLDGKYSLKVRLKNSILYVVYSLISKEKINFRKYKLCILIFVPALILKNYWCCKFK